MDALVGVVERAGQDAASVRARLTELTFVAPALQLPSDVDDPELDPEDPYEFGDAGPTELVPTPAAVALPPVQPPATDVGWLVAELKTRYGKGAAL
jgi:hypothetical protein